MYIWMILLLLAMVFRYIALIWKYGDFLGLSVADPTLVPTFPMVEFSTGSLSNALVAIYPTSLVASRFTWNIWGKGLKLKLQK